MDHENINVQIIDIKGRRLSQLSYNLKNFTLIGTIWMLMTTAYRFVYWTDFGRDNGILKIICATFKYVRPLVVRI